MTQEKQKIVQQIFANNKDVDTIYINPKGEFFTQESYAVNSLPKDKDGKRIGELKEVKRSTKK